MIDLEGSTECLTTHVRQVSTIGEYHAQAVPDRIMTIRRMDWHIRGVHSYSPILGAS